MYELERNRENNHRIKKLEVIFNWLISSIDFIWQDLLSHLFLFTSSSSPMSKLLDSSADSSSYTAFFFFGFLAAGAFADLVDELTFSDFFLFTTPALTSSSPAADALAPPLYISNELI